jgi:hypothetical protein
MLAWQCMTAAFLISSLLKQTDENTKHNGNNIKSSTILILLLCAKIDFCTWFSVLNYYEGIRKKHFYQVW